MEKSFWNYGSAWRLYKEHDNKRFPFLFQLSCKISNLFYLYFFSKSVCTQGSGGSDGWAWGWLIWRINGSSHSTNTVGPLSMDPTWSYRGALYSCGPYTPIPSSELEYANKKIQPNSSTQSNLPTWPVVARWEAVLARYVTALSYWSEARWFEPYSSSVNCCHESLSKALNTVCSRGAVKWLTPAH